VTGFPLLLVHEPLTFYFENAKNRAAYQLAQEPAKALVEALTDKNMPRFFEQFDRLAELRKTLLLQETPVKNFSQLMEDVWADYALAQMAGDIRGVPTGWPTCDAAMGGHMAGDLNALIGRIGEGKSYMLFRMAHHGWFDERQGGHNTLVVTNELSMLQTGQRLAGLHTAINPRLIRRGRLSTITERQVREHLAHLRDGVRFDVVAGNFRKSVPAIKAIVEDNEPDIVYVDAAYLLVPEKKRYGAGGRRETIADVAEELAAFSKDINRPIVITVQFNRQAVKPQRQRGQQQDQQNRNPIAHLTLERIGETDVIGQVCSVVMGIARWDPPFQHTRRWIGFLKGREGEVGYWATNYRFSPTVDMAEIPRTQWRQGSPDNAAPVSLDWMSNQGRAP
jgi:replicative DNA helicase